MYVAFAGLNAPASQVTLWGAWASCAEVLVTGDNSRTRRVVLLKSLQWVNPDGSYVGIPEGWTSDGASLPRSVWWLMGGRLNLDYLRSALVHDWYCANQHAIASNTDASDCFYRGLRADGMGFHRARLCYHATREFGPQWQTTSA